jgi:hypothetical protein
MLSDARSLWYHRVLHNKIYHQSRLARFSVDISTTCSHCSSASEDMVHLLFKCPKKWSAWELALSRQNPHFSFHPDCGKIVIKAGRSQLEPFGVFLLIKRRLSFLTSYSMLYLCLLFCDWVLYICTCVYVMMVIYMDLCLCYEWISI